MAYYGIPSASKALTAASTNDKITIKDLGGTLASAQSLYGADGNDVISLGAAGITATASANFVLPSIGFGTGGADGTISGAGFVVSGTHIVSGNVYGHGSAADAYSDTTGYTIPINGTGATFNLQAIGVRTADQGLRTSNAALFQANAGNDSIAFGDTLARASATTFAGGAGNDLIGGYTYVNEQWAAVRNSSTYVSSNIEGGLGNDTINISGDAVFSALNLNANKGDDLVQLGGTISGFTNSIAGLGAGNDTMSGEFKNIATATIAGGKGNDVIIVSAGSAEYAVFGLDRANATNIDGDGNDSIYIAGGTVFTGSTIYGGGGNDTVTFSAMAMTASIVSLNKGADVFSGEEGLVIKDSTIGLGADNDLFSLDESGSILASRINLGKGTDTVNFGGDDVGSSTFIATVYGGAGADLLLQSASAEAGDTYAVQLGYASNSESTLSAFDTVDMNVNATGTYQFRYDPGATLGSFDGNGVSGTNGVVTFSSTFANGVTARAEAVASNLSDGEAVAFLDEDSKAYFFVKGSSDNLLVQVGSAAVDTLDSLTVSSEKGISLKIH